MRQIDQNLATGALDMKKTIFGLLAIIAVTAASTVFLFITYDKEPEREPASIDYLAIREKLVLSPGEEEWLNEHPVVRARVGSWPPFMISQDDKVSGISIDYLDVVAKVNGFDVHYIRPDELNWANALESIKKTSGVDLIPAIQPSASRSLFINFTEPYQTMPWVIVTRTDAQFISGNQDLTGKAISVHKGFILQKEIERHYPGVELKLVTGVDATMRTLQDVATGKAFATINVLPVMAYYIAKTNFSNLKIAAPADFFDMRLTMGVRKDWPQLVGIINKTLQAMSAKDISAINNSWLSIKYDYGISPGDVRFWTILATAFFILVLVMFLAINKALKKQVRERTKELNQELASRKLAQVALVKSENKFREMVENAPLPLILIDQDGTIQYVNNRFVDLTGYSKNALTNMDQWWEKTSPGEEERKVIAAQWKALVDTHSGMGSSAPFECEIICRNSEKKTIEVMYTPTGENCIIILLDVTKRNSDEKALKNSLHEKEVLLREIHHRVKNNLQIISSLLNLQESTTTVPEQAEVLRECRNRVFSISMVHEELYRSSNLAEIDLSAYLNKLITSLTRNISKQVDLNFNLIGDNILISIEKAIPCGLIANEIATNAIKHAFTGRTSGELAVRVSKTGSRVVLNFSDNGVGLPDEIKLENAQTLGLTLVASLVRQLKANVDINRENGTRFTITFDD